MATITVEVVCHSQVQRDQQFDPLEFPDIELFHSECGGGKIVITNSASQYNFNCISCKENAATFDNARMALRRIIIEGSKSELLGIRKKLFGWIVIKPRKSS